jgi:lysophospholipase L1-like esterase
MSIPKQRARWPRKLAISFGIFLALCLLVEGAMRVRFYTKYGTFLRVHTFATDPVSGLPIPVPGRDTGAIHIDSRGFRNPELEVPKPAGRVRIAFLGASTTYCAEASSNAATWPSLVVDELKKRHPGVDIDFVNAGVAGYVLENIEKNLEYRVKPLAPDVILLYEATNDLTKDTRELAQAQGVYTEHSDREDWLAEISLAWHLLEKNVLVKLRQDAGTQAGGRLKLDPAAIVPRFRARYESVVRAAQKMAPFVAVATFSQRTRRGMSAEELKASCITHFYYMPYMSVEAVIDGFESYNAAIRDVARATGACLIDGEDEIPADAAHFADSVHFTDAGCRAMTRRVVERLEASPALQALLKR